MDFKRHIQLYTQQNAEDENLDFSIGVKSSDNASKRNYNAPRKNMIPNLGEEYYANDSAKKSGIDPSYGYLLDSNYKTFNAQTRHNNTFGIALQKEPSFSAN